MSISMNLILISLSQPAVLAGPSRSAFAGGDVFFGLAVTHAVSRAQLLLESRTAAHVALTPFPFELLLVGGRGGVKSKGCLKRKGSRHYHDHGLEHPRIKT